MKLCTMKVSGILAVVCATTAAGTPLPRPNEGLPDSSAPVVTLAQGAVRGFTDAGNTVFLGIPFADTTGGANRYGVM